MTKRMTADEVIAALKLEPLPNEGGFFRRTYTSAAVVPGTDGRARPLGTAIYFLVTPDGFSALHRLETDEVWFFHAGDAVEHVRLDEATGAAVRTVLGADLADGRAPQLVVPGGVWQGARLAPGGGEHGWALVSCTMSPGWDEREFTLGERAGLSARFPAWADVVRGLTR